MKRVILTMVFCLSAVSLCLGAGEPEDIDQRIKLINDTSIELKDTFLKSCPFGHGQTKRVSIISGLRVIDEEMQRKIDNLEIWHGGCIVGNEKYQVVCTVCRYDYNAYVGAWNKGGFGQFDYQIPLDDEIEEFKQYFEKAFEIDSMNTFQRVESRQTYNDHIGFFTKVKMSEILSKLAEYFELKNVKPKQDQFDDKSRIWYEYQKGEKKYKVTVTKSVKKNKTVDLDIFHGDWEGER